MGTDDNMAADTSALTYHHDMLTRKQIAGYDREKIAVSFHADIVAFQRRLLLTNN